MAVNRWIDIRDPSKPERLLCQYHPEQRQLCFRLRAQQVKNGQIETYYIDHVVDLKKLAPEEEVDRGAYNKSSNGRGRVPTTPDNTAPLPPNSGFLKHAP